MTPIAKVVVDHCEPGPVVAVDVGDSQRLPARCGRIASLEARHVREIRGSAEMISSSRGVLAIASPSEANTVESVVDDEAWRSSRHPAGPTRARELPGRDP